MTNLVAGTNGKSGSTVRTMFSIVSLFAKQKVADYRARVKLTSLTRNDVKLAMSFHWILPGTSFDIFILRYLFRPFCFVDIAFSDAIASLPVPINLKHFPYVHKNRYFTGV